MKNETTAKYNAADVIVTFLVGLLVGFSLFQMVDPPQTETTIVEYVVDEEDFNFKLSSNGYSGWQMGCNYRFGSNSQWNEKTKSYNQQTFLRCANGITYTRTR